MAEPSELKRRRRLRRREREAGGGTTTAEPSAPERERRGRRRRARRRRGEAPEPPLFPGPESDEDGPADPPPAEGASGDPAAPMPTQLEEVLARLADPNLPRGERRRLMRVARFIQRYDKQAARLALKDKALDIRAKNVELRNPELQAQVERLQAANADFKEALGIGVEQASDPFGLMADTGAAGSFDEFGSPLGGGLSELVDGPPAEEGEGGMFGLPTWALLGVGGLLLFIVMRRKK